MFRLEGAGLSAFSMLMVDTQNEGKQKGERARSAKYNDCWPFTQEFMLSILHPVSSTSRNIIYK